MHPCAHASTHAQEGRRFEEAIDELDRQLTTQEGELARNPLKQRWAGGLCVHLQCVQQRCLCASCLLSCLNREVAVLA